MSWVVSNTSPLTNLAAIGQFHLLEALFGQLHIADAVWAELNASGRSWPGRDEVAEAAWISRHTVENRLLVRALALDLDQGESESIALAIEQGAGLILLDERDGRHRAQGLGLKIMGIVGVLLLAKQRGLLEAIKPSLDGLREQAGFYLSTAVYEYALREAGEKTGVHSPPPTPVAGKPRPEG